MRKLFRFISLAMVSALTLSMFSCGEDAPEPIPEKFEAFGWHVVKCDGHDFESIDAAYKEAAATKGQPTVILAKTVKGKGVSFMENNAGWHGKAPNDEQFATAKAELEAVIKELEG